MVKHLLALFAALLPATALAQSFPKPPDVPAYVAMIPTYAAGTTLNMVGDGSSTGGQAPATAYELADIPNTESGWIQTGDESANFCLTTLNGGACAEAKVRFTINATHISFNDPIRNYGQPNTSHCHTFFGNGSANAYSTFASLRNHANKFSASSGGQANGTGYWFPCVMLDNPFSDGKNYVVKPDYVLIYYAQEPDRSIKTHHLLLGLRYVTGFNMDTGDGGEFMENAVATANAQPGTAGRYSLTGPSGNRQAFHYLNCVGSNGAQPKWFKNVDNSDPWAGTCTAAGGTGGQGDIFFQVEAAECWDGVNLWSPTGYYHVVPGVYDNVTAKFVCPNGWYQLPKLQFQVHFTHNGFADYGRWYLSSDAMGSTAAGRTLNPGESFHTDWMNGWDKTTMRTWLDKCLATGTLGSTIPHECGTGVISSTQRLLAQAAAPTGTTGRNPQVDITQRYGTSAANKMWQRPASPTGSATLHVHGN